MVINVEGIKVIKINSNVKWTLNLDLNFFWSKFSFIFPTEIKIRIIIIAKLCKSLTSLENYDYTLIKYYMLD